MYQAQIINADVIKHPNADKLQILTHNGQQFIVGLDVVNGDPMVLFPTDGMISYKFLSSNNLFHRADLNCDKELTGFFDDNGRVRVQTFRGTPSYGFVCTIDMLRVAYPDEINFIDKLKVGDEFDKIGKELLCEEYYTAATRSAMGGEKTKKRKHRVNYSALREHYDTPHLVKAVDIPTEGKVIITEKLHGTSQRTGNVLCETPNWFTNLVDFVTRGLIHIPGKKEYKVISGTRRTIINIANTYPRGSKLFRVNIHNMLSHHIMEGETFYYEIVGYDNNGKPIMPAHSTDSIKDKEFKKLFPKTSTYTYGCDPLHCQFYIYRITMEKYGIIKEYTWDEIESRCDQIGLHTVPLLSCDNTLLIKEYLDDKRQQLLNNSPSVLSDKGIREGIVVRIETPGGIKVYKEKNFYFLVVEGIAKEDATFVDTEDTV
jgi:hypothetical protein